MEYIKSEEFLKQPKKVQKGLLDWWKPEIHDIVIPRNDDTTPFSIMDFGIGENEGLIYATEDIVLGYKEDIIPLLTEGQLREFIESKTNGCISTEYNFNGYVIHIIDILAIESDGSDVKDYFNTDTNNLLQTYWEVACKIAKEE